MPQDSQSLFPSCLFRQDSIGGLAWTLPRREYYALSDDAVALLRMLDAQRTTFCDAVGAGFEGSAIQRFLECGIISAERLPRTEAWQSFEVGVSSKLQVADIPPPVVIEWYPTLDCNQKCSFCFASRLPTPTHAASAEQVDALLENMSQAGVFKFVLLGGEPTCWGPLDYFVNKTASLPVDVSMSTNGLHMPASLMNAIRAHPTFHVSFSLQSAKAAEHDRVVGTSGAFVRTTCNIRAYREAVGPCDIACVYRPQDEEALLELVSVCSRDLGAQSLSFLYQQYATCSGGPGSYMQRLERFAEQAMARGDREGIAVNSPNPFAFLLDSHSAAFSGATERSIWLYGPKDGCTRVEVDPSGDAYPSFRVFGQDAFRLGNCYSVPLPDLWLGSDVPRLVKERTFPPDCMRCKYRHICGGGVIFENLELYGEFCPDPPACPRFRLATT